MMSRALHPATRTRNERVTSAGGGYGPEAETATMMQD